MPKVIEAPIRTRRDSRGMTEEQAQEYVDLLEGAEENEVVLVDDSATDGYEKSYAKGERVRNAIKKFALTNRSVKVISSNEVEGYEGQFVAAVSYKD